MLTPGGSKRCDSQQLMFHVFIQVGSDSRFLGTRERLYIESGYNAYFTFFFAIVLTKTL